MNNPTSHSKHSSKFGLGLVIGSVVAGTAALLLSPRTGKENRAVLNKKMTEWKELVKSGQLEKRVKDIFGEVTEDTVAVYAMARDKVTNGVEKVKNMDGDDYAKLVHNVVDEVKKVAKITADEVKRLQESLVRDWPEIKKDVEKHARTLAKSNGQSKKAN